MTEEVQEHKTKTYTKCVPGEGQSTDIDAAENEKKRLDEEKLNEESNDD